VRFPGLSAYSAPATHCLTFWLQLWARREGGPVSEAAAQHVVKTRAGQAAEPLEVQAVNL